jgi:EmrB/QacA subfamily drug resistance transporter
MKENQKNNGLVAVLTVAVGTFMASLDTSVVNIALPVIQNSFHVTISIVEWVITTYLLVVSSLLLMFGRLSDLYGHRKMFISGFMVFVSGSLFCGLSVNIVMLIISRVIQALGAGMLFSAGPAIITDAVQPEKRGRAFSITAITVAVALCTGPVLGGYLTTIFGWQSIFFINLPIGITGIILACKNIPDDIKKISAPFDITGSILIFTALILILLPLNIADRLNLSALIYCMLGMGFLLIIIFIFFEKKNAHPILDTSLFKNRVFSASIVALIFNFMAMFILAFLAPFYLEKLRMFSPATTGLLYLPMPIAAIIMAPVSGIIYDRFGSRYICTAGMLFMTAGIFLSSFLNTGTTFTYIIISMIITGLGLGMFQTSNTSAIMGSVPQQNRGTASGILATMRNIGMILGVAVAGALFSINFKNANVFYSSKGLRGSPLYQASFVYALHFAFIVAGIFGLLALVASLVKGNEKGKV